MSKTLLVAQKFILRPKGQKVYFFIFVKFLKSLWGCVFQAGVPSGPENTVLLPTVMFVFVIYTRLKKNLLLKANVILQATSLQDFIISWRSLLEEFTILISLSIFQVPRSSIRVYSHVKWNA